MAKYEKLAIETRHVGSIPITRSKPTTPNRIKGLLHNARREWGVLQHSPTTSARPFKLVHAPASMPARYPLLSNPAPTTEQIYRSPKRGVFAPRNRGTISSMRAPSQSSPEGHAAHARGTRNSFAALWCLVSSRGVGRWLVQPGNLWRVAAWRGQMSPFSLARLASQGGIPFFGARGKSAIALAVNNEQPPRPRLREEGKTAKQVSNALQNGRKLSVDTKQIPPQYSATNEENIMNLAKLNSLGSRLFFIIALVLFAVAVVERGARALGCTILQGSYTAGRILEFSALMVIFVIALLLRQIRDELRKDKQAQ